MKTTALIAAVFLLVISPATGLENHNATGDMTITSGGGSSASGTVAAGPNGTQYSAKVGMEGRTQNATADRISEEEISSSKVSFNGTVEVSTPCHVIDHEISETETGYVMDIKTVKQADGNQLCAQVVTGIKYSAEFEAGNGYELEVRHNGEKVKTFQTVSDKGDKNVGRNRSFLQKLLGFLGL